jgi:CRISPR-associated protein Csd1
VILQSLVEYYEALEERGEIARPGWSLEKVSFALNLSSTGELLGIIPQMHTEMRGKKEVEVPDQMQVPERVVRTVDVIPNFLCDNSSYFLGFDNKGKPKRTQECFQAAKQLHQEVLAQATGKAANAVKGFFNRWQPDTARQHPVLQGYLDDLATANLVFRVEGGACAQDDPEICRAWELYYQSGQEGSKQRCLVTGKIEPMAFLHGKIKGVPGAQSSGASLISYNASAYESYGQNDGNQPGTPVGKYAAFAYVTAINHLLNQRKHSNQIGDTVMIYWAEQADPQPQKLFSLFAFPTADADSQLAGVMKLLAQGKPLDNVSLDKRFYVLGLAPNAARISVRFFLQDTFGNMLENLRRHYLRLEIQRPAFDQRQYLSVPALLFETVPPNSKDKTPSPLLAGAVMRSILTGAAYPQSLFGAVMIRIRADRNVNRGRAAIIKAYLLHNHKEEEVTTVALNKDSNHRAYVLGRLFALLEDAQKQANPGINTTIKDRYFTSACATPGSVFPQLLKLSHYHTAKAEYGSWHEREKARLLDKLEIEKDPLPTHFSLKDQGIFMLGYYHQVQARYNKKEEQTNGGNQ